MQAIIVTGGKQYNVKEGDVIFVEKLGVEADETVTFDQVLAVVDGANSTFGAPTIAGAKVEAKVLKNGKGKKIRVFKYRSKKDSKSLKGHRQPTPRCRSRRSLCNDQSRIFRSRRQDLRILLFGPQRLCRGGRRHRVRGRVDSREIRGNHPL